MRSIMCSITGGIMRRIDVLANNAGAIHVLRAAVPVPQGEILEPLHVGGVAVDEMIVSRKIGAILEAAVCQTDADAALVRAAR